jgi:hypothetical protein
MAKVRACKKSNMKQKEGSNMNFAVYALFLSISGGGFNEEISLSYFRVHLLN